MKSRNKNRFLKHIPFVLIVLALFLVSCRKENAEDLLIEDQEVYGSSDSAPSSDDGRIPDDTMDFDPTVMNIANHTFGTVTGNQASGEDENYIYHAGSASASGDVIYLLHRIDRESGIDEIVCSDPSCSHSSDTCEAFLCRGEIPCLQLYGGQIWYCWNTYSRNKAVDLHVSCFGLTDDCPGGKGRHLYRVIPGAIEQMDGIRWVFSQCFFHRGFLFLSFVDRYARNNAFEKNPSVQAFSGTNRIVAYELENLSEIVFDKQGSENPFSPDQDFVVTEGTYEKVTEFGFRMIPKEDTLYFCSTFSEPVNPDTPLDSWEYYRHYQLCSWNLQERRTEIVWSDEAHQILDMWPEEDGVRLLVSKNDDELMLVNMVPGKNKPDELASFSLKEELPLFAAGKIISLQAESARDMKGWLYPKAELYYKIYDLNGKPELELRKSIHDPRYKDPSKAPDLLSHLYSADQEALYLQWEHGIIRVPFADEDLQFYGVTK